ncbi:hypothetical protein EJ419_06280 [Alloscardovia theropitheci]|uniref:Uncharacterized protein n=1 Tax=Alloscardovia theropitheci TaxID=2496842 RepID=A0A4R0QZ55_9BIFI|nr:hypothetical protein [Alloscardovia theropitheci]TCD53856.1 hypothetical protein EJ419_06280 [Alloscardovia theropitheci]
MTITRQEYAQLGELIYHMRDIYNTGYVADYTSDITWVSVKKVLSYHDEDLYTAVHHIGANEHTEESLHDFILHTMRRVNWKEYLPISLYELTGQESGIIFFDNGDTIICNWSGYADFEIPRVFAGMLIPASFDDEWNPTPVRVNVDALLANADIIYDKNNDYKILSEEDRPPLETVYRFDSLGISIYAPNDWA